MNRADSERTKNVIKRIVLITSLCLLAVSAIFFAVYYAVSSKIKPVSIARTSKELGISANLQGRIDPYAERPLNIALFGVDKEPHTEAWNSDAIVVVSINKNMHTIKLASIMRDTYVKIDGKRMGKLNAAYNLGGPELAIKTLNQNFNLDIKEFVSVDISGMSKIIDVLGGGLEINVRQEEIRWINFYLDEANIDSVPQQYIRKPGLQTLNGKQAVAYTRIRYTEGHDAERTERQRTVLTLLFNKIKEKGILELPLLASHILPYVQTSFSRTALLNKGAELFISDIRTIDKERFPSDTEGKGTFINNTWYLVADLNQTTRSLHNYLYRK